MLAMAALLALQSPPTDPAAFLKWSMDRHRALRSYHARVKWSAKYGSEGSMPATRTIDYVAPRRFRIVNSISGGFVMTSVSDGKQLYEVSRVNSSTYPAPARLDQAKSMQMSHPMFCGSPLYAFFAGRDGYGKLVDGKQKPVFVNTGGRLRTVRFFSALGSYGTTDVSIDPRSGLVHRIRYLSEPLIAEMRKDPEVGSKVDGSTTTESYEGIVVNRPIDAKLFAKPKEASAESMPAEKVTVKIAPGTPAPAFRLAGLDGGTVDLKELRGKVVLIDFWATWCPPCRESLPNTLTLHRKYADKGLAVLTVSDETAAKVRPFLKEHGYDFPAYLDPNSEVSSAFGVEAIPTFVIIDRNGKMVDTIVGGGQDARIAAALKRAGLPM